MVFDSGIIPAPFLVLTGIAVTSAALVGLSSSRSDRLSRFFRIVSVIGSFGLSLFLGETFDVSPQYSLIGLAASWLAFGFIRSEKSAEWTSLFLRSRLSKAGLIGLSGIGLAGYAFTRMEMKDEDFLVERNLVVERFHDSMTEITSLHAKTDSGRSIPILEPTETYAESYLKKREEQILGNDACKNRIVRLGSPDPTTNCHGWVFADGAGHLAGKHVEAILRDNGYRVASCPQPNDVVIYRQNGQEIAHSGVVRYVDERGGCFIESKWGILGRYLHPVEASIYGAQYAFYRSSRPHATLIGIAPDSSAEASNRPH